MLITENKTIMLLYHKNNLTQFVRMFAIKFGINMISHDLGDHNLLIIIIFIYIYIYNIIIYAYVVTLLLNSSLTTVVSQYKSRSKRPKCKKSFNMDHKERRSHARSVYPTQDTSSMGSARVMLEEESDAGIIAKE